MSKRLRLSPFPLSVVPVLLFALMLAVATQAPADPLVSVELRTEPGKLGESVRLHLTQTLRALEGVSLVRRDGEMVLSVAVSGQRDERVPVTGLSVVLLQPLRGEVLLDMVEREQHHAVRSLTADAFRVIDHWLLIAPGASVRELCGKAVALFEAAVLEPEKETRRVLARRGVTLVQQRLAQLGYQPGPRDGRLGPRTKAAIRAFQANKGLPVDGEYSLYLVRRLETEAKRREPAILQ